MEMVEALQGQGERAAGCVKPTDCRVVRRRLEIAYCTDPGDRNSYRAACRFDRCTRACGRREAKLVVVAARQRAAALHVGGQPAQRVRAGHRVGVDPCCELRAFEDMQEIAGEAVGDIERRMCDTP